MATNYSQNMGPSEWIPLQTVGDTPQEQQPRAYHSHSFYQGPPPNEQNGVRYPEMSGFQVRTPGQYQTEPLLGRNGPEGSELQLLEKKYEGFYHYSIVNIVLMVLTVLVGLFQVFAVIAYPRHKDDMVCTHIHHKHEDQVICQEDPNDFFTDKESERFFLSLFVLFIVVVKIIMVAVYYAGKYAYDLKSAVAYKIMLVMYTVFLVLNAFSFSLLGVITFGYLAFCAWKMKETLERIEVIKSSQMIRVP